jgi:hypothetical protein
MLSEEREKPEALELEVSQGARGAEVGDIVRVARFGFHHVGVYVGPTQDVPCVVHNDRQGLVVLSTWEEFAGGREVHLHKAVKGGVSERLAIASRARGLIGRKFDLLHFESEGREGI